MTENNNDMANDMIVSIFNRLDSNKINLDLLKGKIDTVLRPLSPELREIRR